MQDRQKWLVPRAGEGEWLWELPEHPQFPVQLQAHQPPIGSSAVYRECQYYRLVRGTLPPMGDNRRGTELGDIGDFENLAHHIEERKRELKLKWKDFEKRSGKSQNSVGKIMRGQMRVSRDMEEAIERAFSWKPGSVREMLAGGEPTVLDVPPEIPVAPPTRALNDFTDKWATRLPRKWFYELLADVGEVVGRALEEAEQARQVSDTQSGD